MKTIRSLKVSERVQLDLLDMQKEAVLYHGTTYNYIIIFIDCVSRYVMLRALPRKTPHNIRTVVESICLEHDIPIIVQCDNDTEFKGSFPSVLTKHGVGIIHSSPYHPQTQ